MYNHPSYQSTGQGVTNYNRKRGNDSVKIDSMHLKYALNDRTSYSTCELDQHADTCCLGSNFILMHDTGRRYEVMPYNTAYDPV